MKIHGLHDINEILFFNDKDLNEIIVWLEEARQKERLQAFIQQQKVQASQNDITADNRLIGNHFFAA